MTKILPLLLLSCRPPPYHAPDWCWWAQDETHIYYGKGFTPAEITARGWIADGMGPCDAIMSGLQLQYEKEPGPR